MKNNIITLLLISLCFISCNKDKKESQIYQNQIGDTPFNKNLDDSSFKFCDSTNVLHKRALIKYDGGIKALEQDLIDNYKFKSRYESFSGFIIIRFAINCNNETGRFRTEILDSDFNLTTCPDDLEDHIMSTFKALNKWTHPTYQGKSHDGYKFYNLKITNGKIEKS